MSNFRKVVCSAVVMVGLGISGCGKSVSGVYSDDGKDVSVEFKSGGKAYLTAMGQTQEADYTIDGDKITLKLAGQSTVFTIKDDGSLDSGQLGGTLKKK